MASVSPTIEGSAQLLDTAGEPVGGEGPPTLGLAVPRDEALSDLQLAAGRWPEQAGEIAVDAPTAEQAGFKVGDTVGYVADGPARQAEIVGLTTFGELDDLSSQLTFTTFDAEMALDVLSTDGNWSAVDVGLVDGAERAAVTERLTALAGDSYEVLTA